MKVSITKEELLKRLSTVSKGMSSRSTLPILSGIMLSVIDDDLIFQTTDLEISIRTQTKVFVEEKGSTVVPGKLFSEIVRNLPDAAIQLSTEGDIFIIECMNSRFTLNTLNTADFPRFPEIEADKEISLPPERIADMVKKVARATSRDESRPVLTGIYFLVEENNISFVATDSYRLAITKGVFSRDDITTFDAIIPGRVFEEVTKSASGEETLTLGISENQALFEFENTVFITRRIEGNYPNYKQLIPSEKNVSVRVDTQALLSAVKRVSLLAQTHVPIKFSFSAEDQNIEVSSRAQEVGGAVEVIEAEITGENTEIGFNHQFIIDGLNAIDSEETIIEAQSSLKPGIFKTEDEGFLYLAMPVRLS